MSSYDCCASLKTPKAMPILLSIWQPSDSTLTHCLLAVCILPARLISNPTATVSSEALARLPSLAHSPRTLRHAHRHRLHEFSRGRGKGFYHSSNHNPNPPRTFMPPDVRDKVCGASASKREVEGFVVKADDCQAGGSTRDQRRSSRPTSRQHHHQIFLCELAAMDTQMLELREAVAEQTFRWVSQAFRKITTEPQSQRTKLG